MNMSKPTTNGADVAVMDPSENDPCMGKASDKEVNYFVRFRSDACRKWNLSHKVFYAGLGLIAAVVVLVIIVVTLGAAWPHVPHSQKYPVCKDSECLRVSSQVRFMCFVECTFTFQGKESG